MPPKHPAPFTDCVLDAIARHIEPGWIVLDPFAGTGKIHHLAPWCRCRTIGVELEPEWAELHPDTIQGDATALPFGEGAFDCVATSPPYANRMADHHNARDTSKRLTYKHTLGRELHPNNAGRLQWGDAYRTFQRAAWAEAHRVVRSGGVVLINVKDHIRGGQAQHVPEWHLSALIDAGFQFLADEHIPVSGMRFGANRSARVDHEHLFVMRKAI